ncbi:MAG: hypothetical protein HY821_18110 [Acidobacteria bacterium]|nr:hypothetical protein [Acidobacteriota bacterium]
MRLVFLLLPILLLAGCSQEPKPAPAPAPEKQAAPPPDDTRRFPADGRQDAKVIAEHILGHPFLPGGNLATYQRGKQQYSLILIRTASPTDAAILLLDFKKNLANPKLIAHFGGYFGKDGAQPTFVFTKAHWLAGVVGLPEAEADAVARPFAARLD